MDNELVRYCSRRLAALKQERSTFDPHWRELGEYVLPRSTRWFAGDRNRGDRRNQKIINDTATNSSRTLRSGMSGGLASPARAWFLLKTNDPAVNDQASVKVWLEDVRDIMLDVFIRSNIYQALAIAFEEIGTFGTTAFTLMEDPKTTLRAYSAPIGTYWLGVSDRGVVDTFAREYEANQRQLVSRFGLNNVPAKVREAYNDKRAENVYYSCVHLVEPNPDYDPDSFNAKAKEFRSVYYVVGEDQPLEVSGFNEFPVMAARWSITGDDIYGNNCPGMQALGDIKALQLAERRKWEALDKLVRPPMTAPMSLQNGTAALVPGGITYVSVAQGQQGLQPAYVINPHLEAIEGSIRQLEARIERAYFADLFLMISQLERSGVTATEINERREEKMLMLGPVLERLNDEIFDPLISRTFAILTRRGLIPPPPPELTAPIVVEYVSILAQAQKVIGVTALEKLTVFVGNQMASFPEAGDNYDSDQAIKEYADMVGAGPRTIRDAKNVAAIRNNRAQQQQMQAQMQMAEQAAGTAQTMSQTPITGDSALSSLISRMTGGAPA